MMMMMMMMMIIFTLVPLLLQPAHTMNSVSFDSLPLNFCGDLVSDLAYTLICIRQTLS